MSDPASMDDFDREIGDVFDPELADTDAWEPTTDDDASRLLWHLRRARHEVANVEVLYADERSRLDDWRSRRLNPLNRRAEGLQRALEGFARLAHEADPKRVTFDLPSGVMRLRPARARVEVFDEDVLVAWAKEAGRFDLLTVAPSKAALAGLDAKVTDDTDDAVAWTFFTSDGEPIPGAVLVQAKTPGFTVTPAP